MKFNYETQKLYFLFQSNLLIPLVFLRLVYISHYIQVELLQENIPIKLSH